LVSKALLIGGLVAMWVGPNQYGNFFNLSGNWTSAWTAYIVIVSITLGLAIAIFLVSITNFVNLPGVQSPYWIIFVTKLSISNFKTLFYRI
jgi:hypothetical protein